AASRGTGAGRAEGLEGAAAAEGADAGRLAGGTATVVTTGSSGRTKIATIAAAPKATAQATFQPSPPGPRLSGLARLSGMYVDREARLDQLCQAHHVPVGHVDAAVGFHPTHARRFRRAVNAPMRLGQ